jgi:hypothetical protein
MPLSETDLFPIIYPKIPSVQSGSTVTLCMPIHKKSAYLTETDILQATFHSAPISRPIEMSYCKAVSCQEGTRPGTWFEGRSTTSWTTSYFYSGVRYGDQPKDLSLIKPLMSGDPSIQFQPLHWRFLPSAIAIANCKRLSSLQSLRIGITTIH